MERSGLYTLVKLILVSSHFTTILATLPFTPKENYGCIDISESIKQAEHSWVNKNKLNFNSHISYKIEDDQTGKWYMVVESNKPLFKLDVHVRSDNKMPTKMNGNKKLWKIQPTYDNYNENVKNVDQSIQAMADYNTGAIPKLKLYFCCDNDGCAKASGYGESEETTTQKVEETTQKSNETETTQKPIDNDQTTTESSECQFPVPNEIIRPDKTIRPFKFSDYCVTTKFNSTSSLKKLYWSNCDGSDAQDRKTWIFKEDSSSNSTVEGVGRIVFSGDENLCWHAHYLPRLNRAAIKLRTCDHSRLNQLWHMKDNVLWFYGDESPKDLYCVPFEADAKLRTRRCRDITLGGFE